MTLRFARLGFVGRHRRFVALLVIAAWVFGPLICSQLDEVFEAPHQSATYEHFDGDIPAHFDLDTCCKVLAHTNVVLHTFANLPVEEAFWQHFTYVAISSALALTSEPGTFIEIDQLFHGPPRIRGVRFATFWSHAPPYTL
jgi:hypothetical protein